MLSLSQQLGLTETGMLDADVPPPSAMSIAGQLSVIRQANLRTREDAERRAQGNYQLGAWRRVTARRGVYLKYMRKQRDFTASEIAGCLKLTPEAARKMLVRMAEDGLVERYGHEKGLQFTRWKYLGE